MYFVFTHIGKYLIGADFSPDILLSLVVLPAIYVLQDYLEVLAPYFVEVSLTETTISVKQGVLTKFEDNLSLKTVENIEVITTPLGRWLNYATLSVYAHGSCVVIPNVKNTPNLKELIELLVNEQTALAAA